MQILIWTAYSFLLNVYEKNDFFLLWLANGLPTNLQR